MTDEEKVIALRELAGMWMERFEFNLAYADSIPEELRDDFRDNAYDWKYRADDIYRIVGRD